jgi:iron(III) transport system substrate-binding protein
MQKFPRRTVLKALAAGPALINVGRSASAAPETGPFEPSKIDLDKARAEGKVILYTSLDTQIVDAIIAAFKKKHGIAVEYFRGGSADVTSKVLAEADAGRLQADMVDASDLAALLVMKDKGLLKPIKSASTGAVAADLRDPDGTWIADRLTQGVLQYNTNEFGPGKAPQSWKDLTDARMKGRLVFFSSANGDGAPRLYTLAKAFGWELLQALAQTNPLRVQTPQVITQVIERGERGAAFATNDNIALRSKQQGKSTDYVFPKEGVPTELGATGLLKGSVHPHAALLFHEFWMSKEGQELLSEKGKYSSRSDVASPPGSPPLSALKLLTLDPSEYKKNRDTILQKMTDIFGGEWGI